MLDMWLLAGASSDAKPKKETTIIIITIIIISLRLRPSTS